MVYVDMIERLAASMDEKRDPAAVRAEFDSRHGVAMWKTPGRRRPRFETAVAADPEMARAPSWWHGDEEASQTFLAAAGVRL